MTLNLSHNFIKKIEGLEGLNELKNLDLSHNLLGDYDQMEQLKSLEGLTSLDLGHNQIDAEE